jgi:hypothetical protein
MIAMRTNLLPRIAPPVEVVVPLKVGALPKPRKPQAKRDRKAYMRGYMARRRAKGEDGAI